MAAFDEELSRSFDVVELDEPVMEQALAMVREHGLRGADAIQLACAVLTRGDVPELILLSSDAELNAAANAEGLQVENPNL